MSIYHRLYTVCAVCWAVLCGDWSEWHSICYLLDWKWRFPFGFFDVTMANGNTISNPNVRRYRWGRGRGNMRALYACRCLFKPRHLLTAACVYLEYKIVIYVYHITQLGQNMMIKSKLLVYCVKLWTRCASECVWGDVDTCVSPIDCDLCY